MYQDVSRVLCLPIKKAQKKAYYHVQLFNEWQVFDSFVVVALLTR